jgi:hypothetical protein
MAYKVFVSVGKGKNRATAGSIPLPTRSRVEQYIKRSPLIRSNTDVQVKIPKGRTIVGKPNRFYKNPLTGKYDRY